MTTSAVGKRVPRVEGAAKVTGTLQYACDIYWPRMLYAKVLRSPYAHARIIKIDTSKAKAYPGVQDVLTAYDIPSLPKNPTSRGLAVMAHDEVLFHGQPVAAVLASDLSVAEEALDLIAVEYEELPAVVDPLDAMRPDAPPARAPLTNIDRSEEREHATIESGSEKEQHSDSPNVTQHLVFSRGDVEKGFAEADVIVEHTYRSSWVHQGYIEPHNAIVDYDVTGQFTVLGSNRGQFPLRQSLSNILGVPETKIRVVPVEPGGAFGSKIAPLAEGIAAVLARHVRRPVKVAMSRSEDLKASIPSPQAVINIKTGAKKDGTLTALQADVIFDAGSFPGGPVMSGCTVVGGYYKFPNLEIHGYEVLTNKASVGALRAPGAPQASFAIESQMDEMAEALGLDPIDLRLKNAMQEGDLLPNNRAYPRIGLKEVLQRVAQTPIWERRNSLPKDHGIGLAVGGWLGGMQPAAAVLTLNSDGTLSVVVGSIDVSGVNTSFAQIAADAFGVPIDRVSVRTADSSAAPYSGQSGGSKVMRTVGYAIQLAAKDALDQMFNIAAERLECSREDLEAANGAIRVKGSPDRALSLEIIATMTVSMGGTYAPIVGRGNTTSPPQAPSFTCQVVEVKVDPDTGEVSILDSYCVQDVGFALNPLSVEGQIQGGVAQSLSMGFSEEMQYSEKGILMNPTLLDYRMPTALDLPMITAILVEVPSEDPLFGVRGVGEPPIAAGAAAIANAVKNATGQRMYKLPITAERILEARGKVKKG